MVSNKNDKNFYFLPTWRVIFSAAVLSITAGVLLFFLLLLIFGVKIVFNGMETLNKIEKAVMDTVDSQMSARGEFDYKSLSAVNYLCYVHDQTGEDYQSLADFAAHYYGTSAFAISSEGKLLTKEPETLKNYNLTPEIVFEMIRQSESSVLQLSSSNLFFSQTENGDYIIMLLDDAADVLSSEIITPLDAIKSVMSNNDIGHNDDNHAYLRFNKSGLVYTENGYIENGVTPDFLKNRNEFPLVIDNGENGTEVKYTFSYFIKDGLPYFIVSKYNSDLDADIAFYSYPYKEMRADENITFTVEITYFILLLIFSLFVYYLWQYGWLHPDNPDYNARINKRKTLIGLTMAMITISAASYFAQTLFLLSSNVLDDDEELAAIKEGYKNRLEQNDRLEDYLTEDITLIDRFIAGTLQKHPELITPAHLKATCDIFSAQYMVFYDLDGNELTASNSIRNLSFPTDKDDPAYILNNLKNGLGPVLTASHFSSLANSQSIRSGINVYDTEGKPLGYLEAAFFPSSLNTLSDSEVLNKVLKTMMLSNSSQYYVVNPETKIVTYAPDISSKGYLAAELGFTEESLKPDFFGKLTLEEKSCYATNMVIDNQLVYTIHPEQTVYLSRIPYTIYVSILFALNALTMLFIMRRKRFRNRKVIFASRSQYATVVREGQIDPGEEADKEEETANPKAGPKKPVILSRIDSMTISWMYQSPEKKLAIAFKALIELGAIVLLLAFTYRTISKRDDSLLLRIISGRWAKGFNVFSLAANLMTILAAIVTAAFLRWCLRMIGQISDARGETVTRLLRSAISYITAIAVAYICLINLGFNPSALVTSAGLVGVAIGIGARDLITDIIAGLFIIFEGSFQVGDIINVSGYEGTVHEIGIRTTKVTGWDLNTKIINNRNMSNIINMSAKNQYSIFYFRIPYTVNADSLKELLTNEFKNFRMMFPELLSIPYLSISGARISGTMECRVVSELPERNRAQVEKKMIACTAKILEENNIPAVFEKSALDTILEDNPKNII